MRARADYICVGTRVCSGVVNVRRRGNATVPIARDAPVPVMGGVETGVDNLALHPTRQRQRDGDPQNVEHGRSDPSTGNADSEQPVNEDGTRRDR